MDPPGRSVGRSASICRLHMSLSNVSEHSVGYGSRIRSRARRPAFRYGGWVDGVRSWDAGECAGVRTSLGSGPVGLRRPTIRSPHILSPVQAGNLFSSASCRSAVIDWSLSLDYPASPISKQSAYRIPRPPVSNADALARTSLRAPAINRRRGSRPSRAEPDEPFRVASRLGPFYCRRITQTPV